MAWKLPVWAALVAYACAELTCPSTSGTCDVSCYGAIASCTGSLDCSTNAACTLACNETGCPNTVVTGLYTPNANDYVLTCSGCPFSTFTTRPTGTSRFLCSGSGCYDTTINCRSPNCHLVCNGPGGCGTTVLRCAGGPGSTCNIECNGGCDNILNVTCEKYPCAVTITGNETNVLPICPGQQLCGDGSCVSATATSCGGAVAEEVEGTSLVIETYSDNSCTGSPISTDSFDTGKCLNGKPGPGSFSYSRCTNLHYCQASGTGTCGGITLFCSPNQPTNVCQGGKKYVCSGAGQLGVGLFSAVAIALATLLL